MKPTIRKAAGPRAWTIIVPLLAGLVVLLLLAPASAALTDPPICYSTLFYVVPCDGWVAPLAGAVAVGLVCFGLWMNGRRRP
jgi:hypothetical protein